MRRSLRTRPGKRRTEAVVVEVVTEGAVGAVVVDVAAVEVVDVDAAVDSRCDRNPGVKIATARE
jgi:hypothetical protein